MHVSHDCVLVRSLSLWRQFLFKCESYYIKHVFQLKHDACMFFCMQTSSFQVVLASSTDTSYAVFTYKCGLLNWFEYGASIGYSAGEDFYTNHNLSRQANVNDIACLNEPSSPWSNVVYNVKEGICNR